MHPSLTLFALGKRCLSATRRAAAVSLLVAMTLAEAGGVEMTGEGIAREVERVNRFGAVDNITFGTGDSVMTVIDRPAGQPPLVNTLKRYRSNHYPDQEGVAAKDLVIFQSGKLRSTGILVTDFRDPNKASGFSIWLPTLRKVRRFAEPDPNDAWGGSNFTYGDVYLRRADDEVHRLLGEARFPGCLGVMDMGPEARSRHTESTPPAQCGVDGRPMYRVESRPKQPNGWYDYRIVWVDKESFADYRSEFFKDGQPVKVIDKDWRSMGLADPRAQYWVYWYALTAATGHEGMAYVPATAVSWNDDLDPDLWTESTLRRIKQ